MSGWVVAAVAALWLIRVGVEARRWREDGRGLPPMVPPRSHVRTRPARPFDQDRT